MQNDYNWIIFLDYLLENFKLPHKQNVLVNKFLYKKYRSYECLYSCGYYRNLFYSFCRYHTCYNKKCRKRRLHGLNHCIDCLLICDIGNYKKLKFLTMKK